MSRLLTDSDYLSVSYSDAVKQLIVDFYPQWLFAEQVGQQEISSNLNQRYDVAQVFTDTTVWKSTLIYKAKNLVQYTESAFNEATSYIGNARWSSTTTYINGTVINHKGNFYTLNSFGGNTGTEPGTNPIWVIGTRTNRVSYKGYIYECISATTGNLPDNATYWYLVCADMQYFYGTVPNTEWSRKTSYTVGTIVWFKDRNYTCLTANVNLQPDTHAAYWGAGVAYVIASNLYPPDNTIYWSKGDNRNPQILRYLLDCTFYHFMRAVPARDFPDRIKEAYDGNGPNQTGGVIGWLKHVSEGDVSLDIPERLDTEIGKPIISGNSISANTGGVITSRDNFTWF